MESIHELLGYENIKIIQNDDMFRFSLDSILLAHFVQVNYNTKRIIDLGCGNAPIPLFLTLKTKAKIYGIEIQKEVASIAFRSVKLNNFEDQIEIVNADFKGIYKQNFANSFDIVISNPPYFKYYPTNHVNKNDYLTIARHEVMANLDDVVGEARKLLIDGGALYLVHRTERLAEIISTLEKYNFQVKRMQFIYSKVKSNESLTVLIEAKKNRNIGLKVMKPMYIYNENDEYTEEVKKIFNFSKQD